MHLLIAIGMNDPHKATVDTVECERGILAVLAILRPVFRHSGIGKILAPQQH